MATSEPLYGITLTETRHGEPGNIVTLPKDVIVNLRPADNLPDSLAIKWWVIPGACDTEAWGALQAIGIGLHATDVRVLENGIFTCVDCLKIKPVLPMQKGESGGTGYAAYDKADEIGPAGKVCYNCCALRDQVRMQKHGRADLYLQFDKLYHKGGVPATVVNWPGTLTLPLLTWSGSSHNMGGSQIDVWFHLPNDPFIWHGVQIGNGDVCRCRRTKEKKKGGTAMLSELDTYDWENAFHYANGTESKPEAAFPGCTTGTETFDREDVKKIIVLEEGKNEESDWLFVGKLKDGRFACIRAGCDYTGWG